MTETRTTGIRKVSTLVAILTASIMLCLLALAITPATAHAASIAQTGATASSITVSWENQNDGNRQIDGYKVSWGPEYTYTKDVTVPATTTSYTIGGLKSGTKYSVKVTYDYTTSYGTKFTDSYIGTTQMATRVVKPTGVKQVKWWYFVKQVEFKWNVQKAATKVEWKLCKASNGKKVKSKTIDYPYNNPSSSFTVDKISNNIVYTVQIRVKDNYGWSPWSDKAYLFTQPMLTKKTKATDGKLTIAWGKINGANGYQVYVSNKEKSGYQKVATLKSTKSTYVLKKFKGKKISKNKAYHVYIVATKRSGNKIYTSGKLYTATVKGAYNTLNWTF